MTGVLIDLGTAALVLVGVIAIADVLTVVWVEKVYFPRIAGEE